MAFPEISPVRTRNQAEGVIAKLGGQASAEVQLHAHVTIAHCDEVIP